MYFDKSDTNKGLALFTILVVKIYMYLLVLPKTYNIQLLYYSIRVCNFIYIVNKNSSHSHGGITGRVKIHNNMFYCMRRKISSHGDYMEISTAL